MTVNINNITYLQAIEGRGAGGRRGGTSGQMRAGREKRAEMRDLITLPALLYTS